VSEAEDALLALARDLVQDMAAGRALELARETGSLPAVPAQAAPAQVPEARTGAGAVHPHLGHHLVREHPHDTISRTAYSGVPRPYEPPAGPDARTLQLQDARDQLAKYDEWAGKVGDYQSASREVEQHAAHQAAQGIPLPGTYKAWTPDEHASHLRYAEDAVARALRAGRATSQEHTADGRGQIWTPERASMHSDLVHEALDNSVDVPSAKKGMLVGGFRHPGRKAVVNGSLQPQDYVHADPELVKEAMAALGLIPEIRGLSPMDASALVHEEAVHIASLIADLAMQRGKNLAVHLPMSSPDGVQDHVQRLKDNGYKVHGVFVHTPVDAAVDAARRGHRAGHEKYRQGKGPGAKLPFSGALAAAETSGGSSLNQESFDLARPSMDSWERWDNSSSPPRRTEQGGATSDVSGGGIPSAEELRRSGQ
jgi:Zeta toxin